MGDVLFFHSRVKTMTVNEFNHQKRNESKDRVINLRIEPLVHKLLQDINSTFHPDLSFPDFLRRILSEYVRGFIVKDKITGV